MTNSSTNQESVTVPGPLQAALLERLVGGVLPVPLLPDVVWQILELTRDEHVDIRQLSALIHRDQALAGHVLRAANSVAYMALSPIVSLQQAISRLGTRALGEVALAAAVRSRVFDAPGYEDDVRYLWQHAVGAAVYAKEIARRCGSHLEGAFLCGLLHDIGKPVILQALVDVQQKVGLTVEAAAANALMDAYHTRVGSLIATAWALPLHVTESIAYHHDTTVTPVCAEAVLITRLADCLSYHLLTPDTADETSVRRHPVVTALHLSPDDVESLLTKRETVLRCINGWS